MMVNSCCANGMDVQMRGFSDLRADLLPLSARIKTAYNAGEMLTGAFECLKQLNVTSCL